MAKTLADILSEEQKPQEQEPLPASALIAELEQPATPLEGAVGFLNRIEQRPGIAEAQPAPTGPKESYLPGEVGQGEALARGALSGVTSGFDEELGAAFQAGLEAMRQKVEQSKGGRAILEALDIGVTPMQTMAGGKVYVPEKEALGDFYREARGGGRMEKERAQRSAPKTYMAGEIGGAIAQQALLQGMGVPVTGPGGAIATGAAYGLGESKADLTKGELGQAALDTGTGAAFGLGGYKVAQAAPKIIKAGAEKLKPVLEKVGIPQAIEAASSKIDDALREFAAMRAIKATGAIQKDINKESARQILKKGETLLAEDIIPWGGSKEVIAERVAAAQAKAGEAMEDILTTADLLSGQYGKEFDWGNVLMRINKEVRLKLSTTGERVAGGAVRSGEGFYSASIFDDIAKQGAAGGGFQAANRLKSDIADGAFSTVSTRLQKRLERQIVGILNDEIEKQLKGVAGAKAALEFTKAKNIYGATKTAQKGLQTAAAQQGNNLFGLSEMIAGPAASGTAAILGLEPLGVGTAGLTGALVTKFAKERGSAALARGAQALRQAPQVAKSTGTAIERLLTTQPAAFGRFAQPLMQAAQQSPQQLAVTDYTLANQNPEYRSLREELLKMKEGEQ